MTMCTSMFCLIVKMKRKASDSTYYNVISDSKSKKNSFYMHQRVPKADITILSDSEEVNQKVNFENNDKFDKSFDILLDEEQRYMSWEYVCGFRNTLPFKEIDPLPKWFMGMEDYNEECKEMLKKDEATRKKIMEKLEKEEFEPFSDSLYKTSSKVLKKIHKGDVEDENYDVSYDVELTE